MIEIEKYDEEKEEMIKKKGKIKNDREGIGQRRAYSEARIEKRICEERIEKREQRREDRELQGQRREYREERIEKVGQRREDR